MREPEWIKNLRWNVTELGDLLGSKFGSPPVNPDPDEEEVIEYFHSYLAEAEALLAKNIAHRDQLQVVLDDLDAKEPNSPNRLAFATAVAAAKAMVKNEEDYLERLERRIQALLEVNGYQDGKLLIPSEGPTEVDR